MNDAILRGISDINLRPSPSLTCPDNITEDELDCDSLFDGLFQHACELEAPPTSLHIVSP